MKRHQCFGPYRKSHLWGYGPYDELFCIMCGVRKIDVTHDEEKTRSVMMIARDPEKVFGKCESCEIETTLVKEVMLCGPCCFGEADTINGNW